jgi:hypothetical protein
MPLLCWQALHCHPNTTTRHIQCLTARRLLNQQVLQQLPKSRVLEQTSQTLTLTAATIGQLTLRLDPQQGVQPR